MQIADYIVIFVKKQQKDMMETQQRNTEYRHVENSNNINNQHIGQTNITVFYVHLSTQINK